MQLSLSKLARAAFQRDPLPKLCNPEIRHYTLSLLLTDSFSTLVQRLQWSAGYISISTWLVLYLKWLSSYFRFLSRLIIANQLSWLIDIFSSWKIWLSGQCTLFGVLTANDGMKVNRRCGPEKMLAYLNSWKFVTYPVWFKFLDLLSKSPKIFSRLEISILNFEWGSQSNVLEMMPR